MIQSEALAALPNIRHAFFTRAGGVSQGIYASLNGGLGSSDAPENVRENRARMAAVVGVAPTHLVSCYQIHSPNVIVAEAPWTRENAPRADALVTRQKGLAIGVSTADCGPVLFADGEAGIIGAAHAGWKGALTGVLEATIVAMERLGASRTRIIAAIGPLIRQPNYEVGAEFVARFRDADAMNEKFFIPALRANHAMFDLPGFIRSRLERAEIKSIDDLGLCTYAEPARFFSYRRTTHRGEGDYGRHVNAIALAP
ncbi:MAG TPA: peptidoglycan editing factor PgeF [Xanthobacteraceae bacterium]|nr:peptidoglycan editing factor PgeF [Xanthobacteraceae bacterium]